MNAEQVTVRGEGLTLSLIIWRTYKRAMPGLVEQTLDINSGLAALGSTLPVGHVFDLPLVDENARPAQDVVRLW